MRRFRHFFIALALMAIFAATGVAQCVSRTVSVSRVQGAVFDQLGRPIPDADVSLKREGQVVASTKTDASGGFTIPISSGAYDLDAKASNFDPGFARIDVGSDLVRAVRPTHIWMILDVGSEELDQCNFTTTSRIQFEKAVRRYKQKR
jgi:Carboxypeptidase regulatory-like domain